MRGLKIAAGVVFVAFVPLLLIYHQRAAGDQNFPGLYSYGFDRYDIPRRTGIERAELIDKRERQIRTYFNDDTELTGRRRVFVPGGIRRSIYGEREVLHMRDVKGLVIRVSLRRAVHQPPSYMALFLAVCAWLTGSWQCEAMRAGRAAAVVRRAGVPLLVSAAQRRAGLAVQLRVRQAVPRVPPGQLQQRPLAARPKAPHAAGHVRRPQGFFFDATMLIATLLTVLEAGILAFAVAGCGARRLELPCGC